MITESRIKLAEVPVGGNKGLVWHRLHSEREDICEALLKDFGSKPSDVSSENWHRELLQTRLRKVDDALDRLMSGSYGDCCRCGRWIEDTKLEFDPAIAFCLGCWERELDRLRKEVLVNESKQNGGHVNSDGSTDQLVQRSDSAYGVALASLDPFDTIRVQTHNSEYRIFLLDPKSGRALVEGGLLAEPTEAVVYGSTAPGTLPRIGWIGVGSRVEIWSGENVASTSCVRSIRVERHTSGETSSIAFFNEGVKCKPQHMALLEASYGNDESQRLSR